MEIKSDIDQFLMDETEEEEKERIAKYNKPHKVYYFDVKKKSELNYFQKWLLKTYPHMYKLHDPAVTRRKMEKKKAKQKRKEIKKIVQEYGDEFNKPELTVEDRLKIKEIDEQRAFWKEVEEARKPKKYRKKREKREQMILDFFNKKDQQRHPKKYKEREKKEKWWKKILDKNPKMITYYKEWKEDADWMDMCDRILEDMENQGKHYNVRKNRKKKRNPLDMFKPKHNGGDYDPTDDMVRRNALLEALDEVIMAGLRDPLHPDIAVDFKPNNIFTEYMDYAAEENLKKELKKQKKQKKSKLGKSKRDKKTKRLDIDTILI